jgi:hypothetical protein
VKALSVHQPWASLIASGKKTIEVRSWRTTYRGPLLICATKRRHGDDPTGVAVAIANLLEVRRFQPSDVPLACVKGSPIDYAWVLNDIRPIKPFPVTGNLGVFVVAAAELDTAYRPVGRRRKRGQLFSKIDGILVRREKRSGRRKK